MSRIVNCLVVVDCEDDEVLEKFVNYCVWVMDKAARAGVEELRKQGAEIYLPQDVRGGEEIQVDGI